MDPKRYDKYLCAVNDHIESVFSARKGNKLLAESMRYSVEAGGKRIRPVLFLSLCDCFGVDINGVLPLATALEFIHTSSLIHDDLPALDNDDMRRGKSSNHVVFGENIAVLSGDALLNLAYEIMLENARDVKFISASAYLARSAGFNGMLGGQALDIQAENTLPTREKLIEIDKYKTGKLIAAPLVMAGIVASLPDEKIKLLEKLGEKLGFLFQFTDDLLDVEGEKTIVGKTLGKDETEGKVTAVTVFGVEELKKEVAALTKECVLLAEQAGADDFIISLISSLEGRRG